jgi:ChrR Cupin-like domain
MPKPELEFHVPDGSGWEQLNDRRPGIFQKNLTKDEEVGNVTRLLKFEKGADFRYAGVLTHEFWEEVWILEGSLTDVTLSRTFPAGSYCCRPPGMKHGPYMSETGALMFEVRYYLPGQKRTNR